MNEQGTSRIAGPFFEGNLVHLLDVERLWQLARELEVFEVSIDDLSDFDSDEPWHGHGADTPTCQSVAPHAKRIQNCDLTFPIILSSESYVLDGMHRVAKAWISGLKTVSAIQFDEPVDPDLVLQVKGRIDPRNLEPLVHAVLLEWSSSQ